MANVTDDVKPLHYEAGVHLGHYLADTFKDESELSIIAMNAGELIFNILFTVF